MYVREHLYFDMQSTRYWRGNNNKKCNINPVQNGIKTHIVAKTKGERDWVNKSNSTKVECYCGAYEKLNMMLFIIRQKSNG